ncbi:MAG: hypothetical protein ACK45H_11155, partial [Bacteroidota bacterium]
YYSTTPEIVWSTGATTATISGLTSGTYTATVTNINGCSTNSSVTITTPSAISITETITNVLCNGASTGSISLAVSGGIATYTYNWSNGGTGSSISGLMAGTYTVTVTDNTGCTASETYTISQPSAITATASATTTSLLCFGNQTTLSVVASGGTAPYTYSLNGGTFQSSNSFTVGAGSYTVTVRDANNCQVNSNTVVITQPSALSASISAGSIACFGGTTTLTVSASGGTTAYQYSLNGGSYQASNTFTVGTGAYTVTVKDANLCTQTTNTLTITEPAAVSSPTAGANTPLCAGQALNLTATTVSGATYSWTGPNSFTSALQNPSIAGTTTANSGTYQVTATVSGCTSAPGSIVVLVNPQPSISAQPSNAQVNQGATTTMSVTASGVGATYQWQYATSASGPWSNVVAGTPSDISYSGETTATLTINAGESAPLGNTNFYRCVVSIGSCNVTSTSGQLTILIGNNTCATAFEIQPDGVALSGSMAGVFDELCTGEYDVWYYFTPTCTNTYQIALNALSDNKDVYIYQGCPSSCADPFLLSGVNTGTTNELISGTFTSGVTYYINVVDYTASGTFNLTVTGPNLPVVNFSPSLVTVPSGASASFSVGASTYSSINWQYSDNAGITWNNISASSPYSGVNSTSLNINPVSLAMDQYLFRTELLNQTIGCPSRYSNSAVLNVWSTNAGLDQTLCSGVNANLNMSIDGTLSNVIFQENFESVTTFLGAGIGNWVLQTDANGTTRNLWGVSYSLSAPYNALNGNKSLAVIARNNSTGQLSAAYNNGNSADIQAITPSISSLSYTGLVLSFNWKALGENCCDYGQVGYSVNGGAVTWFPTGGYLNTGQYKLTTNSTPQTYSLPTSLNNTSNIKLHFRWINDGSIGSQPGFYVDNIVITGTPTITYAWTGPAGATYTPNNTSASTT